MNNYDYPMGSDTSDAPWNRKDPKEVEVGVLIEQCISSNQNIIIYEDEVDDDNTDLEEKVKEQIITPKEILEELPKVYETLIGIEDIKPQYLTNLKRLARACKDWECEETIVTKE